MYLRDFVSGTKEGTEVVDSRGVVEALRLSRGYVIIREMHQVQLAALPVGRNTARKPSEVECAPQGAWTYGGERAHGARGAPPPRARAPPLPS